MDRQEPPEGEEIVGARGGIVTSSPIRGIIVVRMRGYLSADLIPRQLVVLERFHARAPVPTDFFYDAWEATSYDSAVRLGLTKWHFDHRRTLLSFHMVTQSALIKMGAAVANVVLGLVTQHATPAELEKQLEQATARRESSSAASRKS